MAVAVVRACTPCSWPSWTGPRSPGWTTRRSWISCAHSARTTSSTTREDFTRNGRGYDLILDLAAYRPASAYRRSLMPGGRYLYVGGSVATLLQVLTIGPLIGRAGRKSIRLLAVRLGVQH